MITDCDERECPIEKNCLLMAIIPCKAINFERQIPPDMIEESVLSNDFFTIFVVIGANRKQDWRCRGSIVVP